MKVEEYFLLALEYFILCLVSFFKFYLLQSEYNSEI